MELKHLISGSDIRGVALGEHPTLTEEIAKRFGFVYARWIAKRQGKTTSQTTIAVGHDSRLTGQKLSNAVVDGISHAGATVQLYGLCTTPAMFMAIITPGFEPDGSIMVTASHQPSDRNGLKFITAQGGLTSAEIAELVCDAEVLSEEEFSAAGAIINKPFLPTYEKQLMDKIHSGLGTDVEKPLLGLHVVVDAGNGAGGFYAGMLEKLGAWIEGSQYLEPDGRFPNHIPNPEDPEAMRAISEAVVRAGADLGVIFDADCDRAAVVESDGRGINRNRLIALISAILLDEKPGQTIVTDSVTSSGLKKFINDWGGEHYRYKRGYKNVINEAIRLNSEGISCPLAIETSGHAALRDNHFLDDGMYLVTVLIIKAMQLKQQGKTLGSLIADLQEPAESIEIRLKITDADFAACGKRAIANVMNYANAVETWHIAPDNREGVRISFDLDGGFDNGWFLLRLSVHDPVLPLNCESDIPGGVHTMLSALYEVMKNCDGIDLSNLEHALEQ